MRHVAADGAGGAGSHRRRDLADVRDPGVVGLGDSPVNSENGDVGTVDGAAHIEAAGQGDAHVRRQLHRDEIIVDLIHEGLHGPGGVRGRRVAVDPALRMDDIGNGVPGPADRVFSALQLRQKGFDLFLVVQEKLDIVPAREAQIAVAILVGDLADLPDVVRRQEPRGSGAHRVERLAGFSHVHEHPGLQNFVIAPLPVVALNDGRQHFLVIRGADIGSHITSSSFLISSGQKKT